MSSVARSFAQRNNNITKLVPKYVYSGSFSGAGAYDLSGTAYMLNMPNLHNGGGIYYVDMSGVDLSGNLLDYTGRFTFNISGSPNIPFIGFSVNVPYPASYVPGLEFTIFFKNVPYDRISNEFGGPPILTIGLGSFEGLPVPIILSPPVPTLIAPNIVQSLTFKSDGSNFNVVSSGPAGWLGIAAFVALGDVFFSL